MALPRPPADVLLVDDRPENLVALHAILEPLGDNLVLANSGEEALRAMLKYDFAVVLLDVRMPGMDGYETATIIKSRERTCHIPIIFLTAIDTDNQAARRGYDIGAVDYLFKPFDPVVLRSKVRVFIDLFHLKREAVELAHRALHDSLTGLANRALFEDRLEHSLARRDHQVGVFYIDLDGFKGVNDTQGHDAGDRLLVEVAGRLRDVLRPEDTVARLGGDEFAVISDVHGIDDAEAIAARIVDAVRSPVTASVGITIAEPGSDPDHVVRAADTAMYAAKSAGGSAYRWAGVSRAVG